MSDTIETKEELDFTTYTEKYVHTDKVLAIAYTDEGREIEFKTLERDYIMPLLLNSSLNVYRNKAEYSKGTKLVIKNGGDYVTKVVVKEPIEQLIIDSTRLESIEFDAPVEKLVINNNKVKYLIPPYGLKILHCSQNLMKSIYLPETIEYLRCDKLLRILNMDDLPKLKIKMY